MAVAVAGRTPTWPIGSTGQTARQLTGALSPTKLLDSNLPSSNLTDR